MMSEEELKEAADVLIGGRLSDLSLPQLKRLMTVSTFIVDLCWNELERRDAIEFYDGAPVLPYESDHFVDTILTRDGCWKGRG